MGCMPTQHDAEFVLRILIDVFRTMDQLHLDIPRVIFIFFLASRGMWWINGIEGALVSDILGIALLEMRVAYMNEVSASQGQVRVW